MRAIRRWTVAGALIVLGSAAARADEAACDIGRVDLRDTDLSTSFVVELADTAQERAKGLMFREELAPDAGMLFIYDSPQTVAFWMKNTLIPLDMIFVGADGLVRRVHHEAQPGDLTAIEGGRDILAVLEINGGQARRLGIAPGTQMRHPAFDGALAVWPC